MKPIFKVNFTITDRGTEHPPKELELTGKPSDALTNYLRKNRHSMDLSTKYEARVNSSQLVGYEC